MNATPSSRPATVRPGPVAQNFAKAWIALSLALDALSAGPSRAATPSISSQPKDQPVILYQQAAFGVIASGSAPLFYQWLKDAVPIPGATNDQIVLRQPSFLDAGKYSVVVSNIEDHVISREALL